jgi:hypothetical protein
VFGIDWLRNGFPIEKETSVLQDQAEAVAEAMRRSVHVVKRHPGSEPDSFRLTDPTGRICGVFVLRMGAGRQHPPPLLVRDHFGGAHSTIARALT